MMPTSFMVGTAGSTVVPVVALLLAGFESVVVVVTLAMLLMAPATVGRTTIVAVPDAPELRVMGAQVTTLPEAEQPGLADTNVTPLGRELVRMTPVAVDGPLFSAVMV